VRAAEDGFGQRRRFQQVMPAVRHQAATDKRAVGQGIEKQQFAHGVAQQYRGIGRDRLARGATHRGETLLFAQLEHRVETLRMARHQNQQRVGMIGE